MTPMSSWSSLPQVNGNAGSIRSNHWQASSLPPTSAGSLCSYNSLPQSRITTSPEFDSFGGNAWEATSTCKSTTPPRMASFTMTSPRSETDTSSVCKEVVQLNTVEQIPTPRQAAVSLIDVQKANHGRMLLTMSLQEIPVQELPAKDN